MYRAVRKILCILIVLFGLHATFLVLLLDYTIPRLSEDRSVFIGYVRDFEESLPARHLPHYYQVLDINFNATKAEMSHAYKMKSRTMHPDKNPGLNQKQTKGDWNSRNSELKQQREKDQRTKQYVQLQDAYTTLSDPVLRCVYDCNEFRKYGLTEEESLWETICEFMLRLEQSWGQSQEEGN